jgi:hypothetical protein
MISHVCVFPAKCQPDFRGDGAALEGNFPTLPAAAKRQQGMRMSASAASAAKGQDRHKFVVDKGRELA